jgi:hypothetical protein
MKFCIFKGFGGAMRSALLLFNGRLEFNYAERHLASRRGTYALLAASKRSRVYVTFAAYKEAELILRACRRGQTMYSGIVLQKSDSTESIYGLSAKAEGVMLP